MKPYISFVVTARNDNYGGNWVNRINAFIRTLAYQAERTKLPTEIVFVEYNPVPNKKSLFEELTIPKNTFFSFKQVVVPAEFHQTLPDHDQVTVCEFIAKNIGIRRANGEYIVGTNPDVLYGDDLFDMIAAKELDHNTFYRINRKDLTINYIDPSISTEKLLAVAKRHIKKILYNNETVYVSYRAWFDTLVHGRTWKIFTWCPLFNGMRKIDVNESILHTNAAGDFLLMHRDLWDKVRGYDQQTVGSGVMDGYIMYVLYCYGFKQRILSKDLFHIDHHHGGVRYLASHKKFQDDAKKMLETKVPYKINPENWGFPEWKFKETMR